MDKLFNALTPYEFNYNNIIEGLETSKLTFGVMAQDIRKGIKDSGFNPDNYTIVKKNENGYYSVDYVQLIPVLIKEIKILQNKVYTLEKGNN